MKRIILALTASAAVAASAGAALAAGGVSYLGLNEDVSNRGTIEFSTVRAADAGVIEILDLKGNLIATKDVKAGANADVRIPTGGALVTDVVAVLKVGDQIVDQRVIDVR